jgi:hypothetical protein
MAIAPYRAALPVGLNFRFAIECMALLGRLPSINWIFAMTGSSIVPTMITNTEIHTKS